VCVVLIESILSGSISKNRLFALHFIVNKERPGFNHLVL